jgi:hypothetical protein
VLDLLDVLEQVDVLKLVDLLDLLDVLDLHETLGRERPRVGRSGCARNLPAVHARLTNFACSCARCRRRSARR